MHDLWARDLAPLRAERLVELEERVDFTERILARSRDERAEAMPRPEEQ